jgi:hypothetical protein
LRHKQSIASAAFFSKPLGILMTITELKSKVIDSSIASIAGALVGAIGTTLVWLFSDLPSVLYSVLQNLHASILAKIATGFFLVSVGEGIWIYYLRRRSQAKLKAFFGLLWDRDANPHCPSCRTQLSNYRENYVTTGMMRGEPGFKCLHCNHIVFIHYEASAYRKLEEIRENVRSKF